MAKKPSTRKDRQMLIEIPKLDEKAMRAADIDTIMDNIKEQVYYHRKLLAAGGVTDKKEQDRLVTSAFANKNTGELSKVYSKGQMNFSIKELREYNRIAKESQGNSQLNRNVNNLFSKFSYANPEKATDLAALRTYLEKNYNPNWFKDTKKQIEHETAARAALSRGINYPQTRLSKEDKVPTKSYTIDRFENYPEAVKKSIRLRECVDSAEQMKNRILESRAKITEFKEGKYKSIVTKWQNMPLEQLLKLRTNTPHEETGRNNLIEIAKHRSNIQELDGKVRKYEREISGLRAELDRLKAGPRTKVTAETKPLSSVQAELAKNVKRTISSAGKR